MERNVIREGREGGNADPDFASLHPGHSFYSHFARRARAEKSETDIHEEREIDENQKTKGGHERGERGR